MLCNTNIARDCDMINNHNAFCAVFAWLMLQAQAEYVC